MKEIKVPWMLKVDKEPLFLRVYPKYPQSRFQRNGVLPGMHTQGGVRQFFRNTPEGHSGFSLVSSMMKI